MTKLLDKLEATQKQHKERHPAEPHGVGTGSTTFDLRVLAAFAIVSRLHVVRVSLKVDGQAVVAQHVAGQDQVLGLLTDALDAARPHLAPHCDEGE